VNSNRIKDINKNVSLCYEKKSLEDNSLQSNAINLYAINVDSNLQMGNISKAVGKGIITDIAKSNSFANECMNQCESDTAKKDIDNNNIIINNNIQKKNSDKNLSLNNHKSKINNIINDNENIEILNNNYNNINKKNINFKENCCFNNNINIRNNNNNNCASNFNNPSVEIIKFLFEDFLNFKELINVLKSNCNSDSDNKLFEESQENLTLTLNNQLSTNLSEKSIQNNSNIVVDDDKNFCCENNYLNDNSPNDNQTANFFDDVYTKFNNLSKKLASKRKSVCMKLYNILRALVNKLFFYVYFLIFSYLK
jgi:hypothetical protein